MPADSRRNCGADQACHAVVARTSIQGDRSSASEANLPLAWNTPRLTIPAVAPTLCVSIHDVAPQTWSLCERLLLAVHAVAPIPVTFLVVPDYHHLPIVSPGSYDRYLELRLACGDELALHGYSHLDEAPPAATWSGRFRREVVTLREGEFAALDANQARHRLEQGIQWFARRGWPVSGFVAPAWLLGAGGIQAINEFPFQYTTSFGAFHLLRHGVAVMAPSLVYTARNPAGRWFSQRWTTFRTVLQREAPLVRLALHPNDANFPSLLYHCQRSIERLLRRRVAMTKVSFAQHWHEAIIHARPGDLAAGRTLSSLE